MTSEGTQNNRKEQIAIVKALETSADETVISMLINLKEYGELFYIKTLLDMLTGDRSEMLKRAVVEYISDIKIQDAAELISNYVSEKSQNTDIISIVMASWQSPLDFSEYLSPYVQILINGEYMVAFEAFTVIENALYSLTTDKLAEYIATIKKSASKADKDKQKLLLEMVNLMEEAKRAID